MTTTSKPKLWTPGDWNAFFGFGTNILEGLGLMGNPFIDKRRWSPSAT